MIVCDRTTNHVSVERETKKKETGIAHHHDLDFLALIGSASPPTVLPCGRGGTKDFDSVIFPSRALVVVKYCDATPSIDSTLCCRLENSIAMKQMSSANAVTGTTVQKAIILSFLRILSIKYVSSYDSQF
mmetsp:Transcript_17169/g.37479  ORF Transcript_17169/g.37479 Transcript_17169/m.37479 type:complete len:130 (-) Transcript_17169:531-920(-)